MSSSFLASMYLYLGEGNIIIITNSVLLYSILAKRKNRERREFLLIVSQALADTFYAIAFMLIAVHRLNLAATGQENGNSTVWECAIKPALPLHNWATPLLGLLPLTTSLNFLVCSVFPLWYLRAGWIYTTILLTCPHAISFFLSVLNYILLWGDNSPTPALCVAAKGAAHHIAYGGMLSLRMLANLASAVIYSMIILYLRKGQRLQNLTAHQRKTHRNAAITLGFVTLNSMALLFIPDLLLFFNPGNITKDYSTLLYSMTLSKTTINFFIYMWRYGELADMVVATTCRRVPQLRKYFPERMSGYRSSQIGDTSMARFSTIPRKSSFNIGEARKAIADRVRKISRVSPTAVEINQWRNRDGLGIEFPKNEFRQMREIVDREGRDKNTRIPTEENGVPSSAIPQFLRDAQSVPEVQSSPMPQVVDESQSVPDSSMLPVASKEPHSPKFLESPEPPLGNDELFEKSFLPPIVLRSRRLETNTNQIDNCTFWNNY